MRTPQFEREHPLFEGGIQKIFKFANGYGASVIRTPSSRGGDQGLWELAVVQFSSELDEHWKIDFDTPITSDVEGNLSDEDVDNLLEQIERLPPLQQEKDA